MLSECKDSANEEQKKTKNEKCFFVQQSFLMQVRTQYIFCFSMYNRIGEFFLAYSFDYADTLLCFYSCSPLIVLVFSFDFTEMPSPQRYHGEPSLSQCRRLAETITSARQLVESKGTVQSIHTSDSGNPHMRFK